MLAVLGEVEVSEQLLAGEEALGVVLVLMKAGEEVRRAVLDLLI